VIRGQKNFRKTRQAADFDHEISFSTFGLIFFQASGDESKIFSNSSYNGV
jgi:hypothetical protein